MSLITSSALPTYTHPREASIWFSSCYIFLVENVVKPLIGQVPSQEILDAESPKWSRYAEILDEQLSNTKWLAGDNLTIADIAVAAPMHVWREQKLEVEKYPNFRRWIEQVEQLDCWKKTQAAVNKGLGLGASASST